jgi:hypothetical protein
MTGQCPHGGSPGPGKFPSNLHIYCIAIQPVPNRKDAKMKANFAIHSRIRIIRPKRRVFAVS